MVADALVSCNWLLHHLMMRELFHRVAFLEQLATVLFVAESHAPVFIGQSVEKFSDSPIVFHIRR